MGWGWGTLCVGGGGGSGVGSRGGTLCGQLIHFSIIINLNEILQALLSLDMHVILALSTVYFLSVFLTLELSHFLGLGNISLHYYGFLVCTSPPTVLYQSI